MNERSDQLREKLVKWVGLIGLPQPLHNIPAEKAPATMALLEHTLAIAQEDGVITGYEFELSDQLDGQRLVRVTIGVPTALASLEISLDRTSVEMPDAEIPAAGPGMSEF